MGQLSFGQFPRQGQCLSLQSVSLMMDLHSSLQESLERIQRDLDRINDPEKQNWDPIELGLLVAKLEYVDLNVEKERENFRALADTVRKSVPQLGKTRERTLSLVKCFTQELGFRGDTNNYYDPRNSFLNDVYVRRKGIPITLSLIFMGLAREVGLHALGVSFPGHFLVKILPICEDEGPMETSQLFVDTFEGGRILGLEDCKDRLEEWTRGLLPFGPEVMRVSHPRDIVSRMLRNLRAIYSEKEDLPRLYWVLSSLIYLCPTERHEALRERGFLMARMGRFGQAVEDLGEFLKHTNDPRKYESVEKILRYFELQKETSN